MAQPDNSTAPSPYPRAFNHVGINVQDVDAAVAWYQQVFGFEVIIPPFDIVAGEGEPGQRFARLAGSSFGKTRVAYLTTGNGIGIEMFEFTDPQTGDFPENDSPLGEYWRPGLWHFAITSPDVDAFIAEVEAAGGSRATETVETPPGSGYKLVYAKDPFGNVFEVMSVSFEHGLSNLV